MKLFRFDLFRLAEFKLVYTANLDCHMRRFSLYGGNELNAFGSRAVPFQMKTKQDDLSPTMILPKLRSNQWSSVKARLDKILFTIYIFQRTYSIHRTLIMVDVFYNCLTDQNCSQHQPLIAFLKNSNFCLFIDLSESFDRVRAFESHKQQTFSRQISFYKCHSPDSIQIKGTVTRMIFFDVICSSELKILTAFWYLNNYRWKYTTSGKVRIYVNLCKIILFTIQIFTSLSFGL